MQWGGLYQPRLQRGGADVTFVARGAHLAAMRANGLAIESAHDIPGNAFGLARKWRGIASPDPHPLFCIVPGDSRPWEKG